MYFFNLSPQQIKRSDSQREGRGLPFNNAHAYNIPLLSGLFPSFDDNECSRRRHILPLATYNSLYPSMGF